MKNYASILKSKTTLNPQHILEIGSGHGRDAEELALELKVPLSNVHIIEANPIAYYNIKKSYPEMNVYNFAVGSESKELTFWIHDYWPEISSLRRRVDNIDSNSTAVTVKGIRGDDFLTQQGAIKIINVQKQEEVLSMPLLDISEEWRTLKKGTYQLSVDLHDKEVFRETFYVTHNDKKEINVPPLFIGNIGVNVRLPSSTLGPEQSLDVQIDSSGKGYLWIFHLNENKSYELLFPVPKSHHEDLRRILHRSLPFLMAMAPQGSSLYVQVSEEHSMPFY